MKKLNKAILNTAVGMTLVAACSMPVFAQTTPAPDSTAGGQSSTTVTRVEEEERDYGWIGLLGLAGLLGLRRKDEHKTHTSTSNQR